MMIFKIKWNQQQMLNLWSEKNNSKGCDLKSQEIQKYIYSTTKTKPEPDFKK